jgi:hypothetical protein
VSSMDAIEVADHDDRRPAHSMRLLASSPANIDS